MSWAASILAALLAGFVLLASSPALGQQRDRADAHLLRARDRFEYGNYDDAIRILRRLIDEGRLASEQQLIEAHRLLGVSLYYAGDEEESRAAFVRLLSIKPDFRLDPFFHSPKLVEFFDEVRADNEALLAPLRAQRRLLEEQQRLEEEARRRLLEEEERRRAERRRDREVEGEADILLERVVSNHTYVVNWLPFGAGQFQNEQHAKGIGLATAQIITGTASILGYAYVASAPRCVDVELPQGSLGEPTQIERKCGIPADSVNMVRNMERMKWMTGAVFWGLVGYGILDAHLNFEPLKVVSERRTRVGPAPDEAPPEVLPESDGSEDDDDEQGSPALEVPLTRGAPKPPKALDGGPASLPRFHLTMYPWLAPDGAGAALTLRF